MLNTRRFTFAEAGIMNKSEFWNTLRTCGGYQTPDRKRFLAGKIPKAVSAGYYAQLIRIVFHYSRIARSGCLDRDRWAEGSVSIINAVESVGGRVEVTGLQAVAEYGTKPLVFISNHMSMIDALFLPGIVLAFKDTTFVVKESLLRYPFFGTIMQAVHPIAVSRVNPRQDLKMVLTQGQAHLAQDRSMIVFPQATRSTVFDGALFNTMGIKVAQRAGVPVVPVALKSDFQGQGRFLRDFGPIDAGKTIHFHFGDPMPVTGKAQTIHRNIMHFIAKHLLQWGGNIRNIPDVPNS